MRVAVGAIFTESNHLVGRLTGLADFERVELRRGAEVLDARDGVLGGALQQLRALGIEIAPLLYASAVPGGPLTQDCYQTLKSDFLARLRAALPVDGVLLPLHGAAAVDQIGDLEGDLIAAVRAIVGLAVPVVGTLDLHAHVTPAMVENSDALLAWETYPHRDSFQTGERGARMLAAILEGRVKPAMALAKVPVIVGGYMGSTDDGPFAELMRETKAFEGSPGVLSASLFLVQPQLDLPGMGGGGLVITDGDMALAERLATGIAEKYWSRRFDLEPKIWKPAEAIADGLRLKGTVLLLETSDCAGGGATGDSAAVIAALAHANLDVDSIAMVVDSDSASRCHRAGVGATVALELGHKMDPRWGSPVPLTVRVENLTDGRFVYSGGIWGGQTATMGATALIRIGNLRVLVASHATYDWSDEQYRSVGLDPGAAKFVVVKNPMNYRVGYAGRYRAAYVLDTPGPTPASLRHVKFQRLERPYFPADEEIPGLYPTVTRNRE